MDKRAFISGLTNCGFSREKAVKLANNKDFIRHYYKIDFFLGKEFEIFNTEKFNVHLEKIATLYEKEKFDIIKAIQTDPKFSWLDHKRVISDVMISYDVSKEIAIRAILSYPSFAGINHYKKIRQISRLLELYKFDKPVALAKNLIIETPLFAATSYRKYFAIIHAITNAVKEHNLNIPKEIILDFIIQESRTSAYIKLDKSEILKEKANEIRRIENTKLDRPTKKMLIKQVEKIAKEKMVGVSENTSVKQIAGREIANLASNKNFRQRTKQIITLLIAEKKREQIGPQKSKLRQNFEKRFVYSRKKKLSYKK